MKGLLLFLIAFPILVSFILVCWMIMLSLIGLIVDAIKELKDE